ncbi:putative c6 zinc finger domain containing protein [Phaeomoniella chlamydospora]|uniref:Putative c6 zinc finger domain containing protein n=1 Tax=Phaeomoniella chlamydospora TaxID=158046 RepID=A0A0G2EAS9_PHACM|nr:putative c6 zinc finger domain containing protein [Phaeomoniella chlamydospora]
MIEVHFQNKPLDPGQSWQDWLDSMENKLKKWYREYADGHELTDFTLDHGLVNLHRPSPRMPMPPARSLTIAFEAASGSAKAMRDHISNGFYRRPWHLAHFTLESAMIVLFCLRHAPDAISARLSPNEIFEMTKVFTSNFLSIAAQGWTEVSNYAGIYERLLGPLLEAIFSGRPVTTTFGPSQDAELSGLLYPGPAHLDQLRFGSRDMIDAARSLTSIDQHLFNWEDLPNGDGMGTAEYAGAWDLLDQSYHMEDTIGTIGMEGL